MQVPIRVNELPFKREAAVRKRAQINAMASVCQVPIRVNELPFKREAAVRKRAQINAMASVSSSDTQEWVSFQKGSRCT